MSKENLITTNLKFMNRKVTYSERLIMGQILDTEAWIVELGILSTIKNEGTFKLKINKNMDTLLIRF